MRNKKKIIFLILGFLFLANILASILFFELSRVKFLEIIFFNVGQGDAILIKTPQGHKILIDGGPRTEILKKIQREIPFWERKIDLVILTHPEKDHLFGLLEILRRYEAENILWTGVKKESFEFKEWENLIQKRKGKVEISKRGQKISCKNCQWKIEILYPFEIEKEKIKENLNDTSIVSKLTFGNFSVLFTGDISEKVEKILLLSEKIKDNLKAEILKVAHHGSQNSTSEEFLKTVSPKVAIISVGKENKFGHPHQRVLENLEKFAIKVLRTDKEGDIKIISDGENYAVSFF